MRSFGAMAVGGVMGLLILKLAMTFLIPMLAAVFGLMAMMVKWGLILAIGYFVWSFLRGKRREAELH